MCSYIVEKTTLSGSAKGPNGWMHIDNANVYFDHPYHAPFDHALAIDFTCEADGGTERVAVELSASSAARQWNLSRPSRYVCSSTFLAASAAISAESSTSQILWWVRLSIRSR